MKKLILMPLLLPTLIWANQDFKQEYRYEKCIILAGVYDEAIDNVLKGESDTALLEYYHRTYDENYKIDSKELEEYYDLFKRSYNSTNIKLERFLFKQTMIKAKLYTCNRDYLEDIKE